MKTIDFYGPYHFNDIDPKTGEIINNSSNIPNPNLPGIYIWGFMYSYNNFGLAAPINNKNVMPQYNKGSMQFIPYYVGIRKSRIFSRIKEHNEIGNINKPNSSAHKFTRLSPNYMTKFFNDVDFPYVGNSKIRVGELIKLIKKKPNSITYYNNREVLHQIYPNLQVIALGRNQPITLQKINNTCIPDTLSDLVIAMNNFWFCYSPITDKTIKLEEFEAQTFYSLKGKTISIPKISSYDNFKRGINDFTGTRIFKEDKVNNNRIIASCNFPGYS